MIDQSPERKPQDIQFDKADYKDASVSKSSCAFCQSPLSGNYFKLNEAVSCPACKDKIETSFSGGNPFGRLLKAIVFGVPAAVLGAAVYYAIVALTGYEIGLVSIAIGYAVGWAIHRGTDGRGGVPYQILAVLLTYMAICSTYMPFIEKGFHAAQVSESTAAQSNPPGTPAQSNAPFKPEGVVQNIVYYGFLFVVSLAAPFLMGFQNVIGLLIIGFGLWQAWNMNKKTRLNIQGPFTITSGVS